MANENTIEVNGTLAPSRSILPAIPQTVRPIISPEEAKEAQDNYERLKQSIIRPDDIQKVGDRQFLKKSFWRRIATPFNITDQIVSEEIRRKHREDCKDPANCDCPIVYAKYTTRATAPNGRYAEAVGACSRNERGFSKPDHDIPATAHTRSKNRAISDLIGGGEVSAEEMDGYTPSNYDIDAIAAFYKVKVLTGKELEDVIEGATQFKTKAGEEVSGVRSIEDFLMLSEKYRQTVLRKLDKWIAENEDRICREELEKAKKKK